MEAQKEEKRILADDELESVYKTVNFQSVFETQRWNILLFGFRTGLRPESLERLQAGAFKRGETEDGQKYIMPLLGTMKNHQGLDKAEMALLQQKILSAADERYEVLGLEPKKKRFKFSSTGSAQLPHMTGSWRCLGRQRVSCLEVCRTSPSSCPRSKLRTPHMQEWQPGWERCSSIIW